jgi:hypothetical protein
LGVAQGSYVSALRAGRHSGVVAVVRFSPNLPPEFSRRGDRPQRLKPLFSCSLYILHAALALPRGPGAAAALRPDAESKIRRLSWRTRGKRMTREALILLFLFAPAGRRRLFRAPKARPRQAIFRGCNELYFYRMPVRAPRPTAWAATQGRPGQRHWAPT